jgi:hypothetical protein
MREAVSGMMEKLSNARAYVQQVTSASVPQHLLQASPPECISRVLLFQPGIVLSWLRIKRSHGLRRWPRAIEDIAAGITAAETELRVRALDAIALADIAGQYNFQGVTGSVIRRSWHFQISH